MLGVRGRAQGRPLSPRRLWLTGPPLVDLTFARFQELYHPVVKGEIERMQAENSQLRLGVFIEKAAALDDLVNDTEHQDEVLAFIRDGMAVRELSGPCVLSVSCHWHSVASGAGCPRCLRGFASSFLALWSP